MKKASEKSNFEVIKSVAVSASNNLPKEKQRKLGTLRDKGGSIQMDNFEFTDEELSEMGF